MAYLSFQLVPGLSLYPTRRKSLFANAQVFQHSRGLCLERILAWRELDVRCMGIAPWSVCCRLLFSGERSFLYIRTPRLGAEGGRRMDVFLSLFRLDFLSRGYGERRRFDHRKDRFRSFHLFGDPSPQ